jgi:hypothetical protein
MLAQLIAAAAATIVAATLVGQGVHALAGAREWRWTSPAVGLSTLVTVLATAEVLPGRMLLPGILTAGLTIGGAVHLARVPAARPPREVLTLLVPFSITLLPFLAAGRVGILGVNFNNDTAAHLLLAEHMHDAAVPDIAHWYPVGPHGLMGLLISLGIPGAVAISAFTIAVPVLTAAAARSVLSDSPWFARMAAMTLTAVPYLVASYVAQGAFKEVTMAMSMITLAALIEETDSGRNDWRYLPIAALMAGVISTYSYVGIVWPLAGIGLVCGWHALRQLRGGSLGDLGTAIGSRTFAAAVAFVATVAMVVLQLPRIQRFYEWNTTAGIAADNLGNLPGPISRREILGVWFTPDFRLATTHPGLIEAAGIALAVLVVLAALYWLRDRPAVPLAGAATLVLALVVEGSQSPYTVAKAFVIVSPFVPLILLGALGTAWSRWPGPVRVIPLIIGSGAAALALWSSGLALRGAQVGPTDHSDQLSRLRSVIDGKPTLYLGLDDFIQWELRGGPVTQPMYGVLQVKLRGEKGWQYGQSFDVDTIDPGELDRFSYVVAPRIETDSAMPENFSQVAATRDFVVFRREGTTRPRRVLSEGENGTAVLQCNTRAGRAVVAGGGVAAVRPEQIVVPLSSIPPRSKAQVALPLGTGTWDLSLRYLSARPLTLTAPGLRRRMPASLERFGSVWSAGSLTVAPDARSVTLSIKPDYRALSVDSATPIMPTAVIAQRRGAQRILPIAQACGRAVDWYRPRAIKETP